MRKLGSTGALLCAAIAICPVLMVDPVRADEPADMMSPLKQPRATPAVLTSRGEADVESSGKLTRATRGSEPRDDVSAVDRLWIIRGTLGIFSHQH